MILRATERWAREVGIDVPTAEEILTWATERVDDARANGVHPMLVLQGALLMFEVAAAHCQLEPARVDEILRTFRPLVRAVAHAQLAAAERTGATLLPGGIVSV